MDAGWFILSNLTFLKAHFRPTNGQTPQHRPPVSLPALSPVDVSVTGLLLNLLVWAQVPSQTCFYVSFHTFGFHAFLHAAMRPWFLSFTTTSLMRFVILIDKHIVI